jgi:hypothetical protein
VAVLTPGGIQRISVRACKDSEHTIMSQRAAGLYGSEKKMLAKPLKIVGPSGLPIRVEETCNMMFPLGGHHGRRLEIPALVVDMMEQYCGVLQNSMWEWQVHLGKEDAGILPLLQVVHLDDRQWGEMTLEKVRLSSYGMSRSPWKLLACKGEQERMWLSVVRTWGMPMSRNLTEALIRLGHAAQPSQWYPVRPCGDTGLQVGVFHAEIADTLEIMPLEGMVAMWPTGWTW